MATEEEKVFSAGNPQESMASKSSSGFDLGNDCTDVQLGFYVDVTTNDRDRPMFELNVKPEHHSVKADAERSQGPRYVKSMKELSSVSSRETVPLQEVYPQYKSDLFPLNK